MKIGTLKHFERANRYVAAQMSYSQCLKHCTYLISVAAERNAVLPWFPTGMKDAALPWFPTGKDAALPWFPTGKEAPVSKISAELPFEMLKISGCLVAISTTLVYPKL
jgi:hypothetical protein